MTGSLFGRNRGRFDLLLQLRSAVFLSWPDRRAPAMTTVPSASARFSITRQLTTLQRFRLHLRCSTTRFAVDDQQVRPA